MMTTISDALYDPAGNAVAGVVVRATLVAASEVLVAGGAVIREEETATAADGTWSLTLTPISALAVSTGAYYLVTADGHRWTIDVPDAGTHTLADVAVEPAALPTSLAIAVSEKGAAGGVATLDGTGNVPLAQLGLAIAVSEKGAAGGVATLDGTGNVPLAQLGNGAPTAFTDVTPGANMTQGTPSAASRLDASGGDVVRLRGQITATGAVASGSTVFTVQAGNRPAAIVKVGIRYTAGQNTLTINPDGAVTFGASLTAETLFIDGVTYPTTV